jgi:DNA polymerase-3 subunit chi
VARIDFHSQVKDKVHYTCRLIRKIFSLSAEGEPFQRIVVLGTQEVFEDLDLRLWNFSQEDFLPHCFIHEDASELTPVVLTSELDETLLHEIPHNDVLIHLGREALDNIEVLTNHFKRVVEVVSLDPEDLLAGRERYKTYRTMGLELQNFDQKGNV